MIIFSIASVINSDLVNFLSLYFRTQSVFVHVGGQPHHQASHIWVFKWLWVVLCCLYVFMCCERICPCYASLAVSLLTTHCCWCCWGWKGLPWTDIVWGMPPLLLLLLLALLALCQGMEFPGSLLACGRGTVWPNVGCSDMFYICGAAWAAAEGTNDCVSLTAVGLNTLLD